MTDTASWNFDSMRVRPSNAKVLPKLSDFLLDLHRSPARQGSAKILAISTGMPVGFANPYASRSQHISSLKIAQLRY